MRKFHRQLSGIVAPTEQEWYEMLVIEKHFPVFVGYMAHKWKTTEKDVIDYLRDYSIGDNLWIVEALHAVLNEEYHLPHFKKFLRIYGVN
jgi:hypothetical protein